MPTFEILTSALDDKGRRRLAKQIGLAAAAAGQPIDAVTVVFAEPESIFVHGGEEIPPEIFARVEVTIGGLDETQRRQLACRRTPVGRGPAGPIPCVPWRFESSPGPTGRRSGRSCARWSGPGTRSPTTRR